MGHIILAVVLAVIVLVSKEIIKSNEEEQRIKREELSEKIYQKELSEKIHQKELSEKKKRESSSEYIIGKIEIVTLKDDFEDIEETYFNNVCEDGCRHLKMYYESGYHPYIGIGFSIFQNIICLDITSYGESQMGVAKGDRLILLFDDNEKIDITFSKARISNSVLKSNSYILNTKELKKFATINLDKWKLISSYRNIFVTGDNSFFYSTSKVKSKKVFQDVLKHLAKTTAIEFAKKNKVKLN